MAASADIFCRLILLTVHAAFSIYVQICYLRSIFFKSVYTLSNTFNSTWKKYNAETELIGKTVKNYSKIPKHLTFALGEESASYKDLVQIILWSIAAGIPILSFYDHKNELNANKLYQMFLRNYNELTSCIKWGVSFDMTDQSEKMQFLGGTPHLQVNVLDSKHGRQLLTDAIKDLCHSPDLKIVNRAEVEAALDDIMLSKLAYCGSPDLLVINGHVCSTYGLSPWHIGFTEFLTIPCYKLLTVNDFISILRVYANCDQKFGR